MQFNQNSFALERATFSPKIIYNQYPYVLPNSCKLSHRDTLFSPILVAFSSITKNQVLVRESNSHTNSICQYNFRQHSAFDNIYVISKISKWK